MPTSESRVSVEAFLGRPSPSASLSATAGPFHGQRTPGFVVSRSICWQQIQTGQRRLVLDISDTRSVRKNDHPCSPPLRITIHQSWAQLACAPNGTCSGSGAGLSQRGFPPERALKRPPGFAMLWKLNRSESRQSGCTNFGSRCLHVSCDRADRREATARYRFSSWPGCAAAEPDGRAWTIAALLRVRRAVEAKRKKASAAR